MERILPESWLTGLRYITSLLFLLLLTGFCSVVQAQTVKTDKSDYAPGETVIISGSNWQPGESVNLLVEHNFFVDHPDEFKTVIADSSGDIFWDGYVVQEWDLGEIFTLTATGQSSGLNAETKFTDGQRDLTSVSVGSQAGTVTYAQTGAPTFLITVGTTLKGGGTGDLNGTTFSTSGLPTGVTVTSFSPSSVNASNTTPSPTSTLTLSVPNNINAGNYPFTVYASITQGGKTTTVSNNGTLVVTKATLTVNAVDKTRLYGDANPEFTGSVTGQKNSEVFPETFACAALPTSVVGSYDIVPSVSGSTLGNYEVVINNGTLVVTKATLTVNAVDKTRLYGDANPEFTGSVTGQKNSEVFPETFACAALPTSVVGSYDIVPSVSGSTLGNYEVVINNGTLVVTKATLTVNAVDKTRLYGDANPEFTGSVTGQKNSEVFPETFACAALPTSVVGSYDIVPSVSGSTLGNYEVVINNGTLVVTKATLTVNAVDKTRLYGDANPEFTGSVTGQKNSEVFPETFACAALPTSVVGSYDIVPSVSGSTLGNYEVVINNGTLVVTKATLTVNAVDKTRLYGDANPEFTGSVTGQKNSEVFPETFACAALPTSVVGSYDIVPSVSGSTLGNYEVVINNGTLVVTKATLTVNAVDKTRLYGDANPEFTGSVTGQKNSEVFPETFACAALPTSVVGSYDIVPSVSGSTLGNYEVVINNGTLVVTKATLTVNAVDKTRLYGDANPEFTGSVTGQKNSEVFPETFACAALPTSVVGSYDIVPSVSGSTLGNYEVVINNGTLVVTKATLTVNAVDKTRLYGDANPEFTGSVTGQKNSEVFPETFACAALPTSVVGSYDIVPSVSGSTLGNYEVVINNGTLVVTKATLTVNAVDKTRLYGDANPEFTGSVTGQKNSEVFPETFACAALPTSVVGSYDIVPSVSGSTLGNYEVVINNGTLVVTKATLTVNAVDKTRLYGDANPEFTGSVTGQKNSEVFPETFACAALPTSVVGSYDIVPSVSGSTLGNYEVVINNGTLVVTKATLTVNAVDKTRLYGDANPEFTGSVTGQKNSEVFPETFACAALPTSVVGSYDIVPSVSGSTLGNYEVVINNGTLVVTKATLTVNAVDKTRLYGDANPEFTGSVTGQKNSEVFPETFACAALPTSVVGSYDIVPSVSGSTLGNYEVVINNGTLVVTKATLTVNAVDKTRLYGDANPEFTGSVTGQKNSEVFPETFACAALPTSVVGSYDIVPSVSGSTLGNYEVVINNGTLVVTKATLTVNASAKTRYCGQENPIFTGSVTGQKNDEVFPETFACAATATSIVGNYDIIPSVSGATLGNYEVVINKGTLTINGITIDASATSVPVLLNTPAILKATVSSSVTGDLTGIPVIFTLDNGNGGITTYPTQTNNFGYATINTANLQTEVYEVTAVAGSGCATSVAYIPVYDPNGGFVTGGGYIISPVVNALQYMQVGGKANFGFVSKYKKGSNVPDGNTEFQFKEGDLNFSSSSYSEGSLVIAGMQAIYKGFGTINGKGNYGFLVSALDGDNKTGGADKFRIKIWDKNNSDKIVYDNNAGLADNGTPTTALGGGSIVIHNPNDKSTTPAKAMAAEFGVKAYPNPFTDHITFDLQLKTDSKVRLEIYNINGTKLATVYDDMVVAYDKYQFEYTPENLSSGTLIYRLIINNEIAFTGKLIHK